mmetsp:Transcript_10108/g.22741  ORF Transcript_10108/g.22741 Transcript_10108/m.22741 type:complete len:387 (-) Transcript_10108:114-1274(-)|eukprot:CAMPEP_0178443226 /NCGR_PEP_ID=MMETSP0689_2-20121128/38740_1 /TAXON_ID=160604 /ORGANISM="Amphidinium massartii, Strain CS-259" /LENGTH=386 /DNA_ID=CAMNT_0020067135 /DNA_START=54 /DNA_END=1214 /DNA_ORIENTATION=+
MPGQQQLPGATAITEVTPIKGSSGFGSEGENLTRYVLTVLLAGGCYIMASAGLINYNKVVMTEVFPYATHLVLCHMVFGTCCNALLFTVAPSWFPSLTDPLKKVDADVGQLLWQAIPIAILYSISLIFSNVAYVYASVPFLQMMKQGNLVVMYVLSLIFGLETLCARNAALLLFIAFCTCLTVQGEVNFSLTGFLVQTLSQVAEAFRLLMQSFVLSGAVKLDVLTYNLIVMPLCALAIMLVVAANRISGGVLFGGTIEEPTLADVTSHLWVLIPNFMLAFFLNVATSIFIKISSPLSLNLAGILKDMSIVIFAVVALSEVISRQQVIGFALQITGIFIWSMMKMYPKHFEEGVVSGFYLTFSKLLPTRPPATAAETQPSASEQLTA